jgi:hypothetical protein
MMNYGGSITSAFPNSFCSSPFTLQCQLCNKRLNDQTMASTTPTTPTTLTNPTATAAVTTTPDEIQYSTSSASTLFNNINDNTLEKLDKCTHCGINICYKCLNYNHGTENNNNNNNSEISIKPTATTTTNNSQLHYNIVKKEFKHMYNYSKEIVEKLHLLNAAIKVEESAVGELNMIKHQVNTKAIELIKQINQEKVDLISQIERVKQKYESTLNDRKEYYALSLQYKDELRKIIRNYKQ